MLNFKNVYELTFIVHSSYFDLRGQRSNYLNRRSKYITCIMMRDLLWDLAVGGVNHSIKGNGGDDCMGYMPGWQRKLETLLLVPMALWAMWVTLPHLDCSFRTVAKNNSRYAVLTVYSLIFGAELAFKMISKFTCFLFRLQLYFMPGAFFALAFPILNTRFLHGEVFIYYAQHVAIIIIPIYLMYLKGAYEPEKAYDYTWTIFGLCSFLLYHFAVLQPFAVYTQVNLNNIMCPAISDPFQTRAYRMIAVCHQFLLIPIISKTFSAMGMVIVDIFQLCSVAPQMEVDKDDEKTK